MRFYGQCIGVRIPPRFRIIILQIVLRVNISLVTNRPKNHIIFVEKKRTDEMSIYLIYLAQFIRLSQWRWGASMK